MSNRPYRRNDRDLNQSNGNGCRHRCGKGGCCCDNRSRNEDNCKEIEMNLENMLDSLASTIDDSDNLSDVQLWAIKNLEKQMYEVQQLFKNTGKEKRYEPSSSYESVSNYGTPDRDPNRDDSRAKPSDVVTKCGFCKGKSGIDHKTSDCELDLQEKAKYLLSGAHCWKCGSRHQGQCHRMGDKKCSCGSPEHSSWTHYVAAFISKNHGIYSKEEAVVFLSKK